MVIGAILQDEFDLIRASAGKKCLFEPLKGRHLYVVHNNNPVAFYLVGSLLSKGPQSKLKIFKAPQEQEDYFNLFQRWCRRDEKGQLYTPPSPGSLEAIAGQGESPATVLFFTPPAGQLNRELPLVEEKLKESLNVAKTIKADFLLFSLIQEPCLIELPECLIAEKEFEALFSKAPENCPGRRVLDLEKLCRPYQREMDIRMIRCDGVFGPGISDDVALGIHEALLQLSRKKTMDLSPADRQVLVSAGYIRDIVLGLLHVLSKGSPGEVYHLSGDPVSKFIIKAQLLDIAGEEEVSLNIDPLSAHDGGETRGILRLSSQKLRLLGWEPSVSLKEALQRSYLAAGGPAWESPLLSPHQGKLEHLRKLQLGLLKEVDRICKKHGIQYFLVCGSALGAIRHGGFIPWDDDLDIGMLREDHEKFRKVVLKELNPAYSFQSPIYDRNCPYLFEKIRLKGTEFSTAYSYKHSRKQGLFIDLFVYDKTANNKYLQKVHIWLLANLKKIIKYRWKIEHQGARKKSGLKSRLKQGMAALFPVSLYHRLFEAILKFYRNKGNARFLIDGVGMNLKKGPFPVEFMKELCKVPFEDLIVPVPKNYDAYLTWVFGKDYLTPPPLSRRFGHKIVSLDLGAYLSSNPHDINSAKGKK